MRRTTAAASGFMFLFLSAAALLVSPTPVGAEPPQAAPEPAREALGALLGDPDTAAAAGPKAHKRRQKRPIKLGTSGGSVEDFTVAPPNVFCCGGTLGALLMKEGRYFVLSNNHVLARVNQADIGEAISQPGLLDNNCEAPDRNVIGTLSDFKKLKLGGNNKVDAAIAETDSENVSVDGEIIGIGIPGNEIVNPKVGAAVVKSGRSSAVTRGEVTVVNATGFVDFPAECSDEAEILTIRFKKVFLVESTNNKDFSLGGDSGSVIYEDVANCPRAMGLLFAGTDAFTAGNPMRLVMREVKKMSPKGPAELVGCDSSSISSGQRVATRMDRAERAAMRAQRRTEDDILALPGVVAMGVGRTAAPAGDPGEVVLKVYVENSSAEAAHAVPPMIEGVPVEVVVSGRLRALGCPVEGEWPATGGGLNTSRLR